MSNQIAVLTTMPSPAEFYRLYWNRRAFVVRRAISEVAMDSLISAEELAGLAMEEDARSRMIKTPANQQNWSCQFGPFAEEDFEAAGDANWALLVQNVEQFHPKTGALLRHFNFAPRWMMDDVMVSYSERGGSVGPHIDSYHVFLTQGKGARRWKIGRAIITDEVYIDGMDFKVLEHGFEGDEVEVKSGDVLYVPPKFGHEGVTLENALTFSVGLLGPKLSELYCGYGEYLAASDDRDRRYMGEGLGVESAGFAISHSAADGLRDHLTAPLKSLDFCQWLVEFFTQSTHEDFGTFEPREEVLSAAAFKERLKGARLIKPEYVKFALINAPSGSPSGSPSGVTYLGVESRSFVLDDGLLPVIEALMTEDAVSPSGHLDLLRELYNHGALEFTTKKPGA